MTRTGLGATLFLLLTLGTASAQTSLYGHANGFAQTRTVSDGTSVELRGYLTEFGFRNRTEIDQNRRAGFDLNLGMNLLDSWSPYLRYGELSLQGPRGQLALFYGPTVLTQSNRWLSLMHQDPDNLPIALDYGNASALQLPVGVTAVDGLSYQLPTVADRLVLAAALIPAEQLGGETGYSFAATLNTGAVRTLAGFEINGAYANAQMVRLMSDVEIDRTRIGLLTQASQNTLTDGARQTVLLYGFWPWRLADHLTNAKAMLGVNRTEDQNDDAAVQLYFSFLDEVPVTSKLSFYGFSEAEWEIQAETFTFYFGAGARLTF